MGFSVARLITFAVTVVIVLLSLRVRARTTRHCAEIL